MVSAQLEHATRNHTSHDGRDDQRSRNYDIENFENSFASQQMNNNGGGYSGERFKRESKTGQMSEYRTEENKRDPRQKQEFHETTGSFDKASEQREYHYDATSIASDRKSEGRRRYSIYDTVAPRRDEPRRMSYDERMSTEGTMEQSYRSGPTQDDEADDGMVRKNVTRTTDAGNDEFHEESDFTREQQQQQQQQQQQNMSKTHTATSHRSKPMSKTSHKDNVNNQGFYLTHLNMTSADVRRRLKEKEFVEEAIAGMKQKKLDQKTQQSLEKKENLEMLKVYNPWGKPGGGAPKGMDHNNKQKFVENLAKFEPDEEIDDEKNILSFGKPGHGAPLRTQSGRRVTQMKCDPNLRFQNNKDVRKSIENTIRYKADQQSKKTYHEDLDRMVEYKKMVAKEKQTIEQQDSITFNTQSNSRSSNMTPDWQKPVKSLRRNVYSDDPEGFDYNPWGKGYGKPERDDRGNIRRHKFTVSKDHGVQEYSSKVPPEEASVLVNDNSRGGAGAPIRAENGEVKTHLPVTLDGKITVKEKMEQNASRNESSQAGSIENDDNDVKFQPYARKKFIEKLGWSTSGLPHRRSQNAKKDYLDTLQREIREKAEKEREEKEYNKDGGMEFASMMREAAIGKPKRDPNTGELLNHHKVRNDNQLAQGSSTHGDSKIYRNMYHEDLTRQTVDKISNKNTLKQEERRKSLEHIESWNGMWGKPGNGAPLKQQNHHVVAPPADRDYKFKIPYASADSD